MNDSVKDEASISAELEQELRNSVKEIVPQFLQTMPAEYFQCLEPAVWKMHLRAIVAAQLSGVRQELLLCSEDGNSYTFYTEKNYPGQLSSFLDRLPSARSLKTARVFTSAGNRFVLDVFEFAEAKLFGSEHPQYAEKCAELKKFINQNKLDLDADQFFGYIHACSENYILSSSPQRLYRHYRMVRSVKGSYSAEIELNPPHPNGASSITVVLGKGNEQQALKRIARYLGSCGIDIRRAQLETAIYAQQETIALISLLLQMPDNTALEPECESWSKLKGDLFRLQFLAEEALELFYSQEGCKLETAELISALSHLCHQILLRRSTLAFNRQKIFDYVRAAWSQSLEIAQLFVERFDVDKAKHWDEKIEAYRGNVIKQSSSGDQQLVLLCFLDAIKAVSKTNYFREKREALSFVLHPSFAIANSDKELPHAVFFVHGRDFDGFHLRFADIARGGLRIVLPQSTEAYTIESERLFNEVHGLAHAQHLKNKDIPEGGAKGVILCKPHVDYDRCALAFCDAVLDLVLECEHTEPRSLQEQLYLGPDENVSAQLINRIVELAGKRGYPSPNTFMSSKPGAGINHKEYGVTSEGVAVFLETALKTIGIDPRKQSFTLKLTGGPDGDVGGNLIKILIREYGEFVRILGVADGSGSAEDPQGLNHQELLNLVEKSLPIACFNPGCLSLQGTVRGLKTNEDYRARDTLHNRIIADAFVPAGGRPRTINNDNWQLFLNDNRVPSSPIIVEGANLFITNRARKALSDAGVLIIKDSSANKCGVICSSMEIAASMLLSEEEFLNIKPQFVAEVIKRLKQLAQFEAKLLMREIQRAGDRTLPELSITLGNTVNRVAGALMSGIAQATDQQKQLFKGLLWDYLPPILYQLAADRVSVRLSDAYINRVASAVLSTRIIYREGLGYIGSMTDSDICKLAFSYLEEEQKIKELVAQVKGTELKSQEQIIKLLQEGGSATALRI